MHHTILGMDSLEKEIAAFESKKGELEKHHLGKFVIFHSGVLEGVYDTFDAAAKEAIKKFGKGPFLIRQVGKDPRVSLPASVAYKIYAAN